MFLFFSSLINCIKKYFAFICFIFFLTNVQQIETNFFYTIRFYARKASGASVVESAVAVVVASVAAVVWAGSVVGTAVVGEEVGAAAAAAAIVVTRGLIWGVAVA